MTNQALRLSMSLLVRDVSDLIEENIKFHSDRGVDCFVVTDNGSIDGTREILNKLKSDFEIIVLDENKHTFDQDIWVTRMAEIARQKMRADWIILSDADEFWCPTNGATLKQSIPNNVNVVSCKRFNMMPNSLSVRRDDYQFFQNIYKVSKPYPTHRALSNIENQLDYPLYLRFMPTKVMCNLQDLNKVNLGNHSVDHNSLEAKTSDTVTIYHYPLRTFHSFAQNIKNFGQCFDNKRFKDITFWHLRRLHALLIEGKLEDFYKHTLLEIDEEITRPDSRITKDYTIWNTLAKDN